MERLLVGESGGEPAGKRLVIPKPRRSVDRRSPFPVPVPGPAGGRDSSVPWTAPNASYLLWHERQPLGTIYQHLFNRTAFHSCLALGRHNSLPRAGMGRRWAWQSSSRRDTIAYHNVVERRA